MARKVEITKEMIVEKSFELIKLKGLEQFNARSVANAVGCSTQPIFSYYKSMDDLKLDIKKRALTVYYSYLAPAYSKPKPFKELGKAYIEFAKKEKHLFKLLFMDKEVIETKEGLKPVIDIVANTLHISYDEAMKIHLGNWIFVHGIAALIIYDNFSFTDELIEKLLQDYYFGLEALIKEKKNGSN